MSAPSRFCRHGTLAERCPICRPARESEERAASIRSQRVRPERRQDAPRARSRAGAGSRSGLVIRRESRSDDDGYRSTLAPGLRSTADAQRLAAEIGFAHGRLELLDSAPPGLYAEVAVNSDLEEASWLAFLIAYLGPLEGPDPFAGIAAARVPWRDADSFAPDAAMLGPRTAHDPARGLGTVDAYRRWVSRFGSQQAAFTADPAWSPGQRFERLFERLALPGLHRRARYDLLVTLGRLGRFELRAGGLLLVEDDPVVRAAKRVFGIGDRPSLERRASALASAAALPPDTLDLALERWAAGEPISLAASHADPAAQERAEAALGLS
jgi:hypothetical protein